MALSLSLGEPRSLRFGPFFLLYFNALPPNSAKTRTRVPNDIDGTLARTRGRRVARDASVGWRIAGVEWMAVVPVEVCLALSIGNGKQCH